MRPSTDGAADENGVGSLAPVASGQKTGWFFDHRENRARLAPFCAGARVLDAFSYVGGWGLQALAFGAKARSPSTAPPGARGARGERGAPGRRRSRRPGRATPSSALSSLADTHERYEVVVIDPPALIKRRKDLRAGQRAYERLAVLGMRLVADGGLLAFGPARCTSTAPCCATRCAPRARNTRAHGAAARRRSAPVRTIRCTRRSRRPTTSRPDWSGCTAIGARRRALRRRSASPACKRRIAGRALPPAPDVSHDGGNKTLA